MRITSMKSGERFDTSFYIAFWFQLIVEIFGIMHNFVINPVLKLV